MNCFGCERNLSSYLDDELSVEERLAIEAHLEDCQSCRGEFESHQRAWEVAGGLQGGTVTDGLWRSVEVNLEEGRASTNLDDLALMIKGLASEIRDLHHTVDDLRRQVEQVEWGVDERESEITDIELETNPEFMQITAPSEIVILLAFEVNSTNASGLISLCYPFFTLESILPLLGRQTFRRSAALERASRGRCHPPCCQEIGPGSGLPRWQAEVSGVALRGGGGGESQTGGQDSAASAGGVREGGRG